MLTTWRAADCLPDDHPLFFGRPGSLAPGYANLIVQNATHLQVVGCRLDLPSVGYQPDNFAPDAVRCEIDESIPCDESFNQRGLIRFEGYRQTVNGTREPTDAL